MAAPPRPEISNSVSSSEGEDIAVAVAGAGAVEPHRLRPAHIFLFYINWLYN